MESIQLSNGITMPLIGLGTWDLNGQECVKMVKTALQLGYRLVDTAQMYGNEQAVGEGIRQSGIPRSEIFVTTKIYRPSASYEKARAAIDVSLARLGLTYVDLLLLHEPYQAGPQMYRALEEAYAQGKVHAIGISNYDENLGYSHILKAMYDQTNGQSAGNAYLLSAGQFSKRNGCRRDDAAGLGTIGTGQDQPDHPSGPGSDRASAWEAGGAGSFTFFSSARHFRHSEDAP